MDKLEKTEKNFSVEKKDKLYTEIVTGNNPEITVLCSVFNSINNTYYYDY